MSITLHQGAVDESSLDGLEHLPIESYAKSVNNAVKFLANRYLNDSTKLVAIRLNIEFRKEIKGNDSWYLNITTMKIEDFFIELAINICSNDRICAQANITVVPFDSIERKMTKLSEEEINQLQDI